MRNHRRQRCGCQRPNCNCKVYPVKENVVHCCSEETVKHIHPSHTTVMNHHLVKNEHLYPHTTSVENTYNEVDVNSGGSPFGNNQVAGAMNQNNPGQGNMGQGQQVGGAHHHHHHQKQNCGCGCNKKGSNQCRRRRGWF